MERRCGGWEKDCLGEVVRGVFTEGTQDGLGIKNVKVFNMVLLGKWRWRLTYQNVLWQRVLKSKYGLDSQILVKRRSMSDSTW